MTLLPHPANTRPAIEQFVSEHMGHLVDPSSGWVAVVSWWAQKGSVVDPSTAKGPIRIRLA